MSASSQSLRFVLSLRMNSSFITSRPSPKRGPQYQTNLLYLTDVQLVISELPFVGKEGLSISSKSSRYIEVLLNASITSA